MDKKKIKTIPIRQATESDMEHATLADDRTILVHAATAQSDMLILSLYSAQALKEGNRNPIFCAYLERADHISRVYVEDKQRYEWRTGKLTYLLPDMRFVCFMDMDTLRAVQTYFMTKQTGLDPIYNHQCKIEATRLHAKHRMIMDRIDKQMTLIPPAPDDFEEFINRDVLPARYLYYEYNKRKHRRGFCTNCRKDVMTETPMHNHQGVCPACGAAVIFKSRGRFKHGMWDHGFTCLPQKTPAGFVLRYYSVTRLERPDGQRDMRLTEEYRVMASGDKMATYAFGPFLSLRTHRWCEDHHKQYHYMDGACRYPTRLAEIMAGTSWQYSGADLFHDSNTIASLHRYLQVYRRHPYLEYLVKVGLQKLANLVVYRSINPIRNESAKRLHDMLGISRAGLRLLIEMDAGDTALHLVQALSGQRIPYDLPLVNRILADWSHRSPDFAQYAMPHANMDKLTAYANTLKNSRDRTDWLDYLCMASEVGYNLNKQHALFPKNLKKAHDTVTWLHREHTAKRHTGAYQAIAHKIERYAWKPAEEDWLVAAPATALEIVREGHALNHCVHSYIERVLNGDSAILFLRKRSEPDKPFVTIQVRNNSVVQYRGFDNRPPAEPGAQGFIERYSAWLSGNATSIAA